MLHARIVETLEVLSPDRLAEQVDLAHHALRGKVWDKALAYLQQAGEKAMAVGPPRRGGGTSSRPRAPSRICPETHETRVQLSISGSPCARRLFPSGDLERILALLREATALAEALADPRRLAQSLASGCHPFLNEGRVRPRHRSGPRPLALATTSGDVGPHALGNYYLGTTYYGLGHYPRAIDCYTQTVASLGCAGSHERFGQYAPPLP